MIFACKDCRFVCYWLSRWRRHMQDTGHELQPSSSSSSGDEGIQNEDDASLTTHSVPVIASYSLAADELTCPPSPQPASTSPPSSPVMSSPDPPQDPWYPFLSKVHMQLCLLYHGSHRKNVDQVTLQCFMDILKSYVREEEDGYFPHFEEVVNFKYSFWEDKIFQKRNLDGNILANLKAEGMIAMRLGNPRLTKQFDRCPRVDVNGAGIKGITSQSGGLKYNRFEFRKLGPWLTGDLVEMINPGSLSVPGEAVKKQCKFYFHIKSFVMKGQDYFMDGDIFINSTFQGIQPNLHQLESADCFIAVKELKNIEVKYDALQVGNSLRSRFLTPTYSRWIYDQSNPIQLLNMGVDNWNMLNSRLGLSLQNPTVQVPLNVHLDDASMVSTKMWKSASVVTIQIAGASPGFKGGESNNMILALTPTVKISLKRVFDTIVEDIVASQAGGFEAFDMFSKEVVRVKLPVTCVLGDLPAKAEVSCFTGFRADVFCSRDLYNKTTGDGFQIKRTKQTLQAQINEINIAPTMGEKKRLGVRYGLDIKNLDTVLSQLDHFDLTRDMPQDILHHYLLGWTKKTFIALQDDHLSQQDQSNIGLILDTVVLWKEYSTRTTSNAFKSIRSNIGRNIKALTQVIWYPMYLVIAFNQAAHRDLEAIVRIVFYLCKIGYMIFSETTIVWTPYMIRILRDAVNRVGSFFERRMPEILQGPKSHDLQHHLIEDLVRHGNPAGFDCSAGESKMRVQKLKNAFSNKSAPSVDVATKVMKTEIMRHILEGGVLNATGTLFAHENVLQEAKRTRSFRTILGTEEAVINIGDVSMNDWEIVRGKKYKKKTQPPQQHLNLGVPNQNMMTCRKIQTSSGALYRDGGFLMVWNGEVNLFFLHQIYKDRDGFCLAVVELMEDVSAQYPDPFLDEMQIKTWRKSDNFLLVDNFQQLTMVPLLHACLVENPRVCRFQNALHSVTEEREVVDRVEDHFKCVLRAGRYFLVNVLALSVPVGSKFSAITDLVG